jgi:vitamin B12 transporter
LISRKQWMFSIFCLTAGCAVLMSETAVGDGSNGSIVLTAQEIRAMKAHKMTDVLNHVPGVTAGNSSVSIHGSYKVKVFVDGRPINDPTSSHGGVQWELVTPDEVERIEILRGKGGLRYGQDASGGVVLIATRRVRRLTGGFKAYGGNFGTGYGHANLQMTTGKWSMGITGGFETTDGYKINNDKERRQTGAKLAYAPGEQKRFSLSADYLDDDRGLSGLPEYPTPFSRKTTQNTNLSLQADWDRLKSTTFFNEGRNHNTDVSKGLDQTLRVSEWGEDLSFASHLGNWGDLNLGGGYRLGRATGSTFDDRREETFSAFAAHTPKWPGGPWSFTWGLRANINTEFDDAVNPEIRATYKQEKWRLTASYGRSNNTPSFHQRFNQTSSTRPNPDLTMETADNYSLSFFVEPFASLSGSATLFHNRLTDRITYETGDDGVGQYRNFGEVTYTGGDLALSWHAHETLKTKVSYTYLEAADEETGLRVPAKARHTATMNLCWQPREPLSVVWSGKYVSKVYRNKANTKTVPEYFIADLRTEYAFERFSLFGEVKNMFDKDYFYADGLTAPPMTWIVGLQWRF